MKSVRQPKLVPTLLASAILGAFSSAAIADQTTQPSDEHVVVTATMTKHTELTAPVSVSVITADDLAKMPVKDLSEAVRSTTGVSVISSSYGRNTTRIRGLDAKHTLILINGRRINSQDALIRGNDFDYSTIPVSAIERIEVVRGPVSSLYGSEAMGGVINVILKAPTDEFSGSVGMQFESVLEGEGGDGFKGHAYVSGRLSENVTASFIAEDASYDPWRTDTNPDVDALEQRDKTNLMAEVDWQVNPNHKVIADVIYTDDQREADWAHPRTGLQLNEQESTRLNLGLSHLGTWQAVDTETRVYQETMKIDDSSTAYLSGSADVKLVNSAVDFKVRGMLADTHDWIVGGEYRTAELDNARDLASGSIDNYQSAVFAQGEFYLGGLTLTVGGRQDFHEVYGSHFSPRAYAVYNITDNFVAKGGVGGGFRAPGMMESNSDVQIISCGGRCWLTGNEDLEPEKSDSYELGFAYQDATTGAALTYFHTELENKIEYDRSNVIGMIGSARVYTFQNIGEAEVKGVELEAWHDLNDLLSVAANYTYTDAIDKSTGDELIDTPEHLANIDLNWYATKNLTTFVHLNYVGEQYVSQDTTVDAYSLVGLGASYDFNELNVKVGVSNVFNTLLDEEDSNYGYTEKGRTAYVNATFAF
uniref:TonB-dependent receptor domain-containing protein n=1 Tax=Thaumasiovibrio occultus TaxID=1891184 RepID=UPI000B352F7B|nr:TonB-dependent receptor [Thaumasiovibrio occultus]